MNCEIEKRIKNNVDFFKISLRELPDKIPTDNNGKQPEIERNGIYKYQLKDVAHLYALFWKLK